MKKIGIVTKHSVPNYGAMLQAYGLAAALRRLGYDAELVDYDQPATTRYFRPKWSFPPRLNHIRRYWRCKRFVKRRQLTSAFHCTSVETFLPHAENYDLLFTGSDQVWFTGPVQYYDPMYFFDFPLKNTKKASYAPSAGGIDDFGEFKERVRNALSDFSSISVRDDNTERLVKELGFEPTRVVDPTFLHDFHDLIDTRSAPIEEPYLLIFGNLSAAAQKATKAKAEELGLKRIVSLQYKNQIATDRLPAADPVDWLNYYFHASFVVTTYFHGSVFAIKFHKPFVSIPTPGRIKKVSALLKDAELEHLGVLENESDAASQTAAAFNAPIDWEKTDTALNKGIEASIAYLHSAVAKA